MVVGGAQEMVAVVDKRGVSVGLPLAGQARPPPVGLSGAGVARRKRCPVLQTQKGHDVVKGHVAVGGPAAGGGRGPCRGEFKGRKGGGGGQWPVVKRESVLYVPQIRPRCSCYGIPSPPPPRPLALCPSPLGRTIFIGALGKLIGKVAVVVLPVEA